MKEYNYLTILIAFSIETILLLASLTNKFTDYKPKIWIWGLLIRVTINQLKSENVTLSYAG